MESRRESQVHLTDEQFAELLLGAEPAAVREHLAACAQCSAEAEQVGGAIGSFERESRLWAERRAATAIEVGERQPGWAWLQRPQGWMAAAVVVIAMAAGVGVTVHSERQPGVAQPVAKVATAPEVSAATLKADNELLAAIDGELRAEDSTPASVYGLAAGSRGGRAKAQKRISNE
jgi:hypothetical protein